MKEYKVIVPATDPEHAKTELLAWLDQHKEIHQQLLARSGPDGSDDLIMDRVLGDGRTIKHQYRIRQSLLEG